MNNNIITVIIMRAITQNMLTYLYTYILHASLTYIEKIRFDRGNQYNFHYLTLFSNVTLKELIP